MRTYATQYLRIDAETHGLEDIKDQLNAEGREGWEPFTGWEEPCAETGRPMRVFLLKREISTGEERSA